MPKMRLTRMIAISLNVQEGSNSAQRLVRVGFSLEDVMAYRRRTTKGLSTNEVKERTSLALCAAHRTAIERDGNYSADRDRRNVSGGPMRALFKGPQQARRLRPWAQAPGRLRMVAGEQPGGSGEHVHVLMHMPALIVRRALFLFCGCETSTKKAAQRFGSGGTNEEIKVNGKIH